MACSASMFPGDNAKPRELAKYSIRAPHKAFSQLGVEQRGHGSWNHVHPRKGNSSARVGHAERVTDTGTRLESDRAPHRTGDHGHHGCIGWAELSDMGRKGPGAQRHHRDCFGAPARQTTGDGQARAPSSHIRSRGPYDHASTRGCRRHPARLSVCGQGGSRGGANCRP